MLTKLIIERFKSVKSVELETGKINLFIGANRTGKSTIFQAMQLLKQSQGGEVNWDGSYIKLGSYEKTANNRVPGDTIAIEFAGELPATEKTLREIDIDSIEFTFRVEIADLGGGGGFSRVKYRLGSKPHKIEFSDVVDRSSGQSQTLTHKENQVEYTAKTNLHMTAPLAYEGIRGGDTDSKGRVQTRIIEEAIKEVLKVFIKQIDLFYFVPATRGFDKPSYPMHDIPPTEIPTSEGLTKQAEAVVNQAIYSRNNEKKITAMVKLLFPEVDVRFHPVANRLVEIVTTDQIGEYNIISEGFGLNQLDHVFSALVTSKPHSTIFIEEPEISLHPALQTNLSSILIDTSVKDKKQLFITTHSEHILLGLLQAVMEGKIGADDLFVYFFERGDDGITKVTHLKVNERGELEGGLKGFMEVDMQHIERFLQNLEKRSVDA